MKNNKPLIVTIVILIILNMATLTFVWMGRYSPNNERYKTPNVERYLHNKLNLSPSQQQEFQKERAQHFDKTTALMKNVARCRLALSGMESDDNQEIDSLLKIISKNNNELERLNFNHFKKLRSICDNTQKLQFDSLMKDMMSNEHHKRRQHHRMPQ